MRWFEVSTPDGRTKRVSAQTREALKALLQPGYQVSAEVYGADEHGQGGYAAAIDGKSLLGALLEAHGDELMAWLAARGFTNG